MNKTIGLSLSFLMCLQAYAQNSTNKIQTIQNAIQKQRQDAVNRGSAQGNGIAASAAQGQTVQKTDYDSLQTSSQYTANNAQKGQATAIIMGAGLGFAAQRMFNACSAAVYGYPLCIAGGVLASMALQSNRSAKSFDPAIYGAQKNACAYSSTACGAGNPYTGVASDATITKTEDEVKKVLGDLSKGGYQIDLDSGLIKTSKGDVNMKDPGALEAAMGKEDYDKMMGQVAAIEKEAKAKVDQIKVGSYGGGYESGGSAPGLIAPAEPEIEVSAFSGLGGSAAARNPAEQVKGMSKNFNGEPIGVASDSIFEMMSRRYQLKNSQKLFFGPEVQ